MAREFLKYLVPPPDDASARHIFYWRLTISVSIVASFLALSVAHGFVSWLPAFAYANDVEEKIEQEITKALIPINQKLSDQSRTLEDQGRYLEQLVKRGIREDIYGKLRHFCNEQNQARRAAIRAEIDDLQDEYKDVTGSRYPEPTCANL